MNATKIENAPDNRWLIIEDDGTQQLCVMHRDVTTPELATMAWAQMKAELEAPQPAPEVPLKEQLREAFFDVLTESIQAGNLDMTLKEVVAQVDTRIKDSETKRG